MYEMPSRLEQAQERMERERERMEQALIWLREEPSSRRPSHTRADIARAALAIADEEGYEALSIGASPSGSAPAR